MRKCMFLCGIAVICISFATVGSVYYSESELSIYTFNIEALSSGESSDECKWKLTDCPGIGTGDYEACLKNGDGNSCSCGDVTRDCPE